MYVQKVSCKQTASIVKIPIKSYAVSFSFYGYKIEYFPPRLQAGLSVFIHIHFPYKCGLANVCSLPPTHPQLRPKLQVPTQASVQCKNVGSSTLHAPSHLSKLVHLWLMQLCRKPQDSSGRELATVGDHRMRESNSPMNRNILPPLMHKKNLQISNGYTSLFPMVPVEPCFFCMPCCQASLDLSPK